MTALPNPFLSASDGLHPLSSVAAASGIPCKPQGAAAEIQSSCGGSAHLPEPCADVSSERYDPVNWEVERATSQSAPHEARPADVTSTSPEAMSAGTDCINEIFTFARGLMRDYQPDFQALLNEIAPFPMEYLPDYRLGDDDQPLFLQGAVA